MSKLPKTTKLLKKTTIVKTVKLFLIQNSLLQLIVSNNKTNSKKVVFIRIQTLAPLKMIRMETLVSTMKEKTATYLSNWKMWRGKDLNSLSLKITKIRVKSQKLFLLKVSRVPTKLNKDKLAIAGLFQLFLSQLNMMIC